MEALIDEMVSISPHKGRWKDPTGKFREEDLLVPDNGMRDRNARSADGNGDRLASMSNVHGTWFDEETLKNRWFDKHNNALNTRPVASFQQAGGKLYPLDRMTDCEPGDTPGLNYSPWEPTVEDMTPTSKAIGSYASKGGSKKGAIPRQNPKPLSGTNKVPPKVRPPPEPPAVNWAWGKVREGDESDARPDPAPGYTGNYYARRFDKGEEDLSMATRINRRRQQAIERRFSASPYAHEIAMDVMRLSDGVEYTGPTVYGWRSFPPQGLVDIDGDGKVDSPFTESGAFALQKIDPRMAQSMLH